MREKLETCLARHTSDAEREAFGSKLTETEDWIYDEGEDAKKSILAKRLEGLKQTGDRFKLRYSETEARPEAITALSNACEASFNAVNWQLISVG